MKVEQGASLGGSKPTGCSCSAPSGGTASARTLNTSMRLARVGAGIAFMPIGRTALRRAYLWPLAALARWFGISHVVAGATGFAACPDWGRFQLSSCGATSTRTAAPANDSIATSGKWF